MSLIATHVHANENTDTVSFRLNRKPSYQQDYQLVLLALQQPRNDPRFTNSSATPPNNRPGFRNWKMTWSPMPSGLEHRDRKILSCSAPDLS
jgi:hypothetical protein